MDSPDYNILISSKYLFKHKYVYANKKGGGSLGTHPPQALVAWATARTTAITSLPSNASRARPKASLRLPPA